jgi:DNA helicase HerA-like ATPase
VSGNVEEGTLLQLKCANKNILYQVLQGITYTETLESRNEAAGIVGEAIQLGSWNSEEFTFNRFGWVPPVNSPLYIADNIEAQVTPEGYLNIGTIPNTNYPIFLNKETAITHHLAILGVTGTGKSVFTRNLVRNIASQETKVIIVDFTLEHSKRLNDLEPKAVVAEEKQAEIFAAIDSLSAEYEKFANNRIAQVITDSEKIIKVNFYNAIKEFMQGDDRLRLFELPDVANSTAILEYTKWFFKALFAIARNENNYGRKVCVVLEEAHTVIPEWNFVGVSDKSAQSLVNSIGQIALQGRKYGIGFVIVAQRTANVSKTVLTQCNSIIAFQQFDRTSGEFLSNYVGDDMVQALPTLNFKQAIAVGKAFKANMPLIFEVPNIEEPMFEEPIDEQNHVDKS